MGILPKSIQRALGLGNGKANAGSVTSTSATPSNSNLSQFQRPAQESQPLATNNVVDHNNPEFLPFPPPFNEKDSIKANWLQNSLMRAAAYVQQQAWMDDYATFTDALKNGEYSELTDSLTSRSNNAAQVQDSVITLTQGGGIGAKAPETKSAMESATYVRLTRILRSVREQVATLAQLNPNISYTCYNPKLDPHVATHNKRAKYIFNGPTYPREALRKAFQYSGVFKSSYLFVSWANSLFGAASPDITLIPLAPGQVLPDGLPPDNDINRATACHIHLTYPTHELMLMFPDYVETILRPSALTAQNNGTNLVSPQAANVMGVNNNLQRFGNGILDSFSRIQPDHRSGVGYGHGNPNNIGMGLGGSLTPVNVEGWNNRLANVVFTFLPDTTVNSQNDFRFRRILAISPELATQAENGAINAASLMRGDSAYIERTRYHCDYEIANVQTGVDSGLRQESSDPATGEKVFTPVMRAAETSEVMLYPSRRLVIWHPESQTIFYDGPSHFWHGQVPVEQVCLDPWPWKLNGGSMANENICLEETANELLNMAVHSSKLRLNPPSLWEEDRYTPTEMQSYDLTKPGFKTRIRMKGGEKSVEFPTTGLSIDPSVAELVQLLLQQSDYQYGTNDLTALARLQQVPSGDSIEKLLTAIGPLAMGQAQNVENMLTRLGNKMFWTVLQFDSTARRLQILGPNGLVAEDFDWSPGDLIPDQVGIYGQSAGRYRRGLEYGRQFTFTIARGSTFNITDVQQRLLFMQLWQAGFPIDPETIAKAWKLENFGEIPGNTVLAKYYNFMNQNSKYAELIQARAALSMAKTQMHAAQLAQGMGLGQGDSESGGDSDPLSVLDAFSSTDFNLDGLDKLDSLVQPFQDTETRGRNYEGLTAPKLAQRDGGTRTTVTQ